LPHHEEVRVFSEDPNHCPRPPTAKQNKTKQNKTKQNKTKQNKTKQKTKNSPAEVKSSGTCF
jgi:hypothetical protein